MMEEGEQPFSFIPHYLQSPLVRMLSLGRVAWANYKWEQSSFLLQLNPLSLNDLNTWPHGTHRQRTKIYHGLTLQPNNATCLVQVGLVQSNTLTPIFHSYHLLLTGLYVKCCSSVAWTCPSFLDWRQHLASLFACYIALQRIQNIVGYLMLGAQRILKSPN